MRPTVNTTVKLDGLKQLRANVAALKNNHVKVGFVSGSEVGKPEREGSGREPWSEISEVARVAIWNEFGTKTIPARPFFLNALAMSRGKLKTFKTKIAGLVMNGKITSVVAFENLGLFMKAEIQMSIRRMTSPANAESTKAAKGSSHPLIDTGQMINSVSHATVSGSIKEEGMF